MGQFLRRYEDTVQEFHEQAQLGGAQAELVESLREAGLLNRAFRGLETVPGVRVGARPVRQGLEKIEEAMSNYLLASKVLMCDAMKPLARASSSPDCR